VDPGSGKKRDPSDHSCSPAYNNTRHTRTYGTANTDAMYNPSWGWFVFGTTHRDNIEGCADAYYDDSEGTESDISNIFTTAGNYVRYSYYAAGNARHDTQGDHHWNNDGKITLILCRTMSSC
jgi:hypothetical protein